MTRMETFGSRDVWAFLKSEYEPCLSQVNAPEFAESAELGAVEQLFWGCLQCRQELKQEVDGDSNVT